MQRHRAHTLVRALCAPARAEEYIREAEHQDGLGYWNQFTTQEELEADVKLYFSAKDDGSPPVQGGQGD